MSIALSVIIPTRHRPQYLRRALASLVRQTVPQESFEIMVVDNGPSRETAEVTASFAPSLANLRYLQEPAPGLHSARHRGMREAQSGLLLYLDDDVEVAPGWLEAVWEGFTLHDAALVGGRNLPRWEVEPPGWLRDLWYGMEEGRRALGYLSLLDFGETVRETEPCYVWGCNFSIRKEVLLQAGGFHPDSVPEELLHLRGDGESYVAGSVAAGGLKALYHHGACVHHFVPAGRMSPEYFQKRAFCQGISDSYTALRRDPEAALLPQGNHPLGALVSRGGVLEALLRRILPAGVYFRASVDAAYRRGLAWHRERYLEDPGVREWVHRESYLDVT